MEYSRRDEASRDQGAVDAEQQSRDDAALPAREAEVLRGLDHPHIVRFYDSGIPPSGRPYIVMEFLVGESWAATTPTAVD